MSIFRYILFHHPPIHFVASKEYPDAYAPGSSEGAISLPSNTPLRAYQRAVKGCIAYMRHTPIEQAPTFSVCVGATL